MLRPGHGSAASWFVVGRSLGPGASKLAVGCWINGFGPHNEVVFGGAGNQTMSSVTANGITYALGHADPAVAPRPSRSSVPATSAWGRVVENRFPVPGR